MRANEQLYFRVREGGAAVFRIETTGALRRPGLVEIAEISHGGAIRLHPGRSPSEAELTEIRAWAAHIPGPDASPLAALAAQVNRVADWVEHEAPEDVVRNDADPALMAMNDLRQMILARLAELAKDQVA